MTAHFKFSIKLTFTRARPAVRSAYSSGDEKGRPSNSIQDPFSYPFAGVVPSLSPSELSCGLPLPPVPSPLSTASSPPSPPPRAPGGAASRPLPSAAPPPAACLPTRWRSGPASGSKFKLHAHTSAFSLSLSSEQHFVFAARESVGQVRGQQWGREGPSVEHIQDPFSDPFARALPSLSPSGLPRGRPFPSVPSPLSTGSSPPSPPPRDLSVSFTHTRQLSALA